MIENIFSNLICVKDLFKFNHVKIKEASKHHFVQLFSCAPPSSPQQLSNNVPTMQVILLQTVASAMTLLCCIVVDMTLEHSYYYLNGEDGPPLNSSSWHKKHIQIILTAWV